MKKEKDGVIEMMSDEIILDLLTARKRSLEVVVKEKERALRHVPEGHLRINRKRKKAEYYLRSEPDDYNGKYISKENLELVGKLAQKDYDRKILSIAEKELMLASDYLEYISSHPINGVYDGLSGARRELIKPVRMPDNVYMNEWVSKSYEHMGFEADAPEYYSDNGTRVRSKSEIIIANQLEKSGIAYKYEFPLTLSGKGTVRPDFICLNIRSRREYVWEHFGMMDDEEYVTKNIQKINSYEMSGYYPGVNMITTFETSQIPINSNIIKALIRQYLL